MAELFYISLVESAAKLRGDPPVARQYIEEAMQQIDSRKEVEVDRYPTGRPSLKGIYDVAARLATKTIRT